MSGSSVLKKSNEGETEKRERKKKMKDLQEMASQVKNYELANLKSTVHIHENQPISTNDNSLFVA